MTYHLLTGATGLLGSYLLRELYRGGRNVAVVVRPSNRHSARQRIEDVMLRWEKTAGYSLPRPVVLEGDICRPNLGLEPPAIAWLGRHCQSVIHSAASLSFQADRQTGEPRRSNVEGTRHVLELCRQAGIRQFHHISTAFVCGLREGRVLESELDLGQTMGNDYEQSKLDAEKLVRGAEFLERPTIYRPGTVVGDSRTGYTATFHAFYAPLQLVSTVADKVSRELIRSEPFLKMLGLSGQERKSLVPVDWIAAVIGHIHGRAELHGQTYHLTPRQPVRVAEICAAMEQVLLARSAAAAPAAGSPAAVDLSGFEHVFREQMDVYKSHWRDDPEFDSSNTAAAAPHLPCPVLGHEDLVRLVRFAVETNFGWPRPPSLAPALDVQEHLDRLLHGERPDGAAAAGRRYVNLQVSGPGGWQWKLLLRKDVPVAVEAGLSADGAGTFYMNSTTFRRLVAAPAGAAAALDDGRVLVEGRGLEPRQMAAMLCAVVGGGGGEKMKDECRV